MDAAVVDATTPLGTWASIRGYFTPATLFLVLNLVIGTIALTSRSQQRRRREHHDYAHHHDQAMQYQESLLDPHHEQQQEYHHYYQQPQYATPPPPAPLARTSSVLDRLRSIGLYRFRSGDFPPEYGTTTTSINHHDAPPFARVEEEATTAQYARSRSEPAPASREAPPRMKKSGTEVVRKKSQVARAPVTRVVEAVAEDTRAEEFIVAGLSHEHEPSSPQKAEYLPSYQEEEEEEYVPPPAPMRAPPPLSRTSSVLDRLRSLGLYSFLGADQTPAAAAAPAPVAADAFAAAPPAGGDKKLPPAHAYYDRSRSEPREKKQTAAEARTAKSSSSTTRKPAAAGPSLLAEEECVNARAEAFIDSFRKEQSQKRVVHHDDEDEDEHEHEHVVVPPPPAPLARTSSVLDRLRSFSLYLRSADPVPEDPYNKASAAAAGGEKKTKQSAQQYARSRSEPAREQGKKKAPQGEKQAKMTKTSSEANLTEECVDARADDFINKFRQQLQLQRLNSLLSYGGSKQ